MLNQKMIKKRKSLENKTNTANIKSHLLRRVGFFIIDKRWYNVCMKNKNVRNFLLLVLLAVFCSFAFFGAIAQGANDVVDLQSDMSKLTKKIDKTKEVLNTSLSVYSKVVAQVGSTQKVITVVAGNLSKKEEELQNLNSRIGTNKKMLQGYLREAYFLDQKDPLLELTVDENIDFSDIMNGFDQTVSIKKKILGSLTDIQETQAEVEKKKGELEEQKSDKEDLLATQKATQGEVAGDIQDAKAILADLQKKFAELQGDLNKLLGSNYNAKDIKDAVGYASDKTGVPQGFLVGVLKMETNLGANVGGCTYGEVESGAEASYKAKKLGPNAWATFQSRRNTFKGICKEVGINYEKQKVSCNPKGYTGTGGAMGVAQFMPDTWNAYKNQVSSYTGHRPASPWNLTDGVMAMALKLGRVPGVTAGKESAYKSAACAYLGTCYAPYINGILYWAKNYKDLI